MAISPMSIGAEQANKMAATGIAYLSI